jgi:hypothetical protein
MATDPISGARYALETDSGDVALWVQRGVNDLSSQVIPRYTTTTARDNAYTAAITAGTITSIANGSQSVANGIPYRRINGTWRIDKQRVFIRAVSITGGAGSIGSGGSVESNVTSGITLTGGSGVNFTLYEAGTISVNASFRAGPTGVGAALCSVKINGSTIGNVAVSRTDGTVSVTGGVALAAGTHTVSLRVDTSASACLWTDGSLVLAEYTAE